MQQFDDSLTEGETKKEKQPCNNPCGQYNLDLTGKLLSPDLQSGHGIRNITRVCFSLPGTVQIWGDFQMD